MKKIINIQNRKEAINSLQHFKNKQFVLADVKFENVHLLELNHKVYQNIFSKNDLFINTISLWELMQPMGERGGHNYHDLSPEDIVDALSSITEPYCILKTEISQYAIMSTSISHFGEPLFIVIEINAGLVGNTNANINKLVTMFPMSDIQRIINNMNKKNILYINSKQKLGV